MSGQKEDLPTRFVEQLLGHGGSYIGILSLRQSNSGHGGSYTDIFAWDRVGSIYGGNNDITSSSTSITPCHIEGVCNCM